MSKIDLAVMMRQSQQKKTPSYILENMLDNLLDSIESDGLSAYFSTPLCEDEKKFMKIFFNILKSNVKSIENIVQLCSAVFLNALNIKVERAKELTSTFGIHLIEGGGFFNLLYLSWSKGVFDEE